MIYQFGEYELDLELYELRHAGDLCKLEPKAFNVLCYLIKNRDRIVPKEELLTELWDSSYISDAALNSCIMTARRAVGDSGSTQHVVQTQRGRGYRFIAAVVELHPDPADHSPVDTMTHDDVSNMLCPRCDRQIPLPAAFCLYCGAELSRERSRLEVPLVGRERESMHLQEVLQEVQAGKGQVVDIVGDAGIGKSCLVDHCRQKLLLDGITFVHVFCPPVRIGAPGEPMRNMLRQCCGLVPTDSLAVVQERLTWWLSQLDIEPEEVMPYLLHLLACPGPREYRLTQQPALLKAQLLRVLRRIFVAYSQRQPLVVAVEDIQWLDQTSADCLALLTPDISDLPVLLLLTRRPGAPPKWYERGVVTSLPLQPLEDAARAELLQTMLSTQTVAPGVERALLARAEGHPGFLTELAQWCVDMRVHDDPSSLPASLTDAVKARLARAPEATRHLLQTASVIGPAAVVSVLEQMWDGDQALEAVLEEAVLAGFYDTPHDPVDGIYRFSHAALQTSIYQNLPDAQRQRLHTSVAKALEIVYAEHPEQISGLLAWHYVQAGQPERSLHHWHEAACEAARWGDYRDAIELSKQMLAAIDGLPERQQQRLRLECLLDQARWLTALGRPGQCVELLQTEHEVFSAVQEPRIRGQYALALSLAHSQEGAWEQAVASAQQAVEDAMACRDGATAGQAYAVLAMERYRIGRADEGASYSRQAIGLLEQPETQTKRAFASFVLGLNCMMLGQFREAIEAERQTQEIGEAFADPQLQASAAWAMGWVLATQGDWAAGVVACQRALAAAPDPLTMGFALGVLGYAHLEQEKPQEAIANLEQAIRIMQQCGYERMRGLYTAYLGTAYFKQAELDRAQALAQESWQIAETAEDRYGSGWSLRLLAQVAQRRGALDEAREQLNRALRDFLAVRASFEVARTQLQLADVACERDAYDAAVLHARDAYHRLTMLDVSIYVRHVERWAASRGLPLNE